jgi:hypothetical protein
MKKFNTASAIAVNASLIGFDPELLNLTQSVEIEQMHIDGFQVHDLEEYDMEPEDRDQIGADAWSPSEPYCDAVLDASEADWAAIDC